MESTTNHKLKGKTSTTSCFGHTHYDIQSAILKKLQNLAYKHGEPESSKLYHTYDSPLEHVTEFPVEILREEILDATYYFKIVWLKKC